MSVSRANPFSPSSKNEGLFCSCLAVSKPREGSAPETPTGSRIPRVPSAPRAMVGGARAPPGAPGALSDPETNRTARRGCQNIPVMSHSWHQIQVTLRKPAWGVWTAPESSGSAKRGRAETLLPRKHRIPCGSRSHTAGPSFHLDPDTPAARAALSRQNAVPSGRYRLTTRHGSEVSAVPSEMSTQKSEPWAGPPPGGDAFISAHGATPPAGKSQPFPGGKPSWGTGERAHFAEGRRRRLEPTSSRGRL